MKELNEQEYKECIEKLYNEVKPLIDEAFKNLVIYGEMRVPDPLTNEQFAILYNQSHKDSKIDTIELTKQEIKDINDHTL